MLVHEGWVVKILLIAPTRTAQEVSHNTKNLNKERKPWDVSQKQK